MKPSPSISNPPDHMNPMASDIWSFVCRRYSSDVYESKTLREQWKTALNHFHRLCSIKRVEPYLKYSKASTRLSKVIRDV